MLRMTISDRKEHPPMDTNIQKYQAFVYAVQYKSFTKAASVLNYSQSGISRMIADLERECGVTLLERGRSGIRLTSDGTKLLPHAVSLCREYEKFQVKVDELNGLQSGIIRIGTFSSVATHWLPNITKAFQKDYPRIEYELLLGDYTEIEGWIAEGRVDCGFLRLPTLPQFETIFLAQDKLKVLLPEGHPLADCEVFPLEALQREPFLLLEKDQNTVVSDIFRKHRLKPNIQFTTWDDYAIMSMVEAGLGISILPDLILQRIPYRVIIKELEVPAYRRIGLAMKNKKDSSAAMKTFLKYLV